MDGSDWRADFYIPAEDLWIEIDGFREGERPNEQSFSRKLDHYADRDMQYLVVNAEQSISRALDEHIAGIDIDASDPNPTF